MPKESEGTLGEMENHLKIVRKQSRMMLKMISKKVKMQMILIKTRRRRKETRTMKKKSSRRMK